MSQNLRSGSGIGEHERQPINNQGYTEYDSTMNNVHYGGENPAYISRSYGQGNIEETEFQGHVYSTDFQFRSGPQDTLIRRKARTAKEASSGIEDIIMEMPSRTIGKSTGARMAKYFEIESTPRSPHSSYSKTFGSRYLKRQMLTHQDSDVASSKPDAALNLYNEIADEHGNVTNEEIRELPISMLIKKQIRLQADADREKKKSKNIGGFRLWRYNTSIKFQRFKDQLKKSTRTTALWNYHLKQIEGNFGSGVRSYFTFLRSLFFLSIPSFILNFAFISLPQVLQPPQRTNPNVTFTGEEILTGANWLTETIMYYGYYINGNIEVIQGAIYKMPLAYLLATAGYFFLCLIWISKETAASFRSNYIEGKLSSNNFISKVFCAWNFGVTSAPIAKLHHKIITTDLKEVLAEHQRSAEVRSVSQKLQVFLFRFVTWSLYLVLTGGCMALIYFLNKIFLREIKASLGDAVFLQQMALSFIVSTINLIMPLIINIITHIEKYKSPRHELYVAVFRNYVLKMGMLGVICAFWTDDSLKDSSADSSNSTLVTCWETELGQEIYRLVIVDFIFSIFFATFCAEFIRHMLSKYCCKALEKPEFSIVNGVMDLIYGQTLCWLGVYFSPLLALIIIIKYFFIFYIKKVSVMMNCQASQKRWRAAQSRTMFIGLLLTSFLLSAIFLCVVVFREKPSLECGPYRGLDFAYDAVVNEFEILFQDQTSEWFAYIMSIITNVWFLYAVIAALSVMIALKRSHAIGYSTFAKALREQIALEGQDKQLLLRWLQNVSNQSKPSGGDGDGPADEHRVPILQHSEPSTSQMPHPSAVQMSGYSYGDQLKGDVLTYVDPQHVEVSNFGRRASLNSPAMRRKKEHVDPLLYKALAKQQQQRPHSMFTGESSRISAELANNSNSADDIEMSNLSKDEDQRSPTEIDTAAGSNHASDRPSTNQPRPSSFQGHVYTLSEY